MAFDLSKLTAAFAPKNAKRSVVGIDIGSSAIKVVQLHNNRGVPTLETYGELQLGPYGNTDIGRTVQLQPVKLIEALVDILRESSATATQVALSTSYGASFSTIITIPKADQDKIEIILPVEARKYVPVPLSEVELNWLPIAPSEDRTKMNILLIASHLEAMNRYETVLQGANLNTLFKEIEILSTIRSTTLTADTRVAIIDFGAQATRLYIVEKGQLRQTHSVLVSGNGLTTSLTKALNKDFRTCEELKRRVGLAGTADEPLVQKTLVNELDRGLREIHRVIARFEADSKQSLEHVLLSGGGSQLYGLRPYAEEMFARPVRLADPFAKVAYPAFLEDTLTEAGPSFAAALGVAVRAIQDS